MPWTYDRDSSELRRPDGTLYATIERDLNHPLCWFLGIAPLDGDPTPLPIESITVDEQAGVVSYPPTGQSWTIKTEDTSDQAVALGQKFVAEIVSNTGWSQARAIWFVKFLWRFVRAANALLGR